MVSGGGAFGKEVGYEGDALMYGISALIKARQFIAFFPLWTQQEDNNL